MSLSERPFDPVYQVIRQVPREYMVPSGQETETQVLSRELPILSVADAIEVNQGRKTIWFAGRLDYRDFVTNEPQVHRFYLRYIRTEEVSGAFNPSITNTITKAPKPRFFLREFYEIFFFHSCLARKIKARCSNSIRILHRFSVVGTKLLSGCVRKKTTETD